LDLALLFGCMVPVTYAGITDARKYIIPNYITFPVLAAGLIYSLYRGTITDGLLAFVVGFGIGLFFYFFNAMGAGDVKLMAAMSPWLGFNLTLSSIFIASIIAVVWGLIKVTVRGKLRPWAHGFFRGLGRFILSIIWRSPDPKLLQFPQMLPDPEGKLPISAVPFGACLVIAAWLAVKGGVVIVF